MYYNIRIYIIQKNTNKQGVEALVTFCFLSLWSYKALPLFVIFECKILKILNNTYRTATIIIHLKIKVQKTNDSIILYTNERKCIYSRFTSKLAKFKKFYTQVLIPQCFPVSREFSSSRDSNNLLCAHLCLSCIYACIFYENHFPLQIKLRLHYNSSSTFCSCACSQQTCNHFDIICNIYAIIAYGKSKCLSIANKFHKFER